LPPAVRHFTGLSDSGSISLSSVCIFLCWSQYKFCFISGSVFVIVLKKNLPFSCAVIIAATGQLLSDWLEHEFRGPLFVFLFLS